MNDSKQLGIGLDQEIFLEDFGSVSLHLISNRAVQESLQAPARNGTLP